MKIVITESQHKFLVEQFPEERDAGFKAKKLTKSQQQSSDDYHAEEGGFKNEPTNVSIDGFYNPKDKHTLLTIAQIGTAFIPFVGPFISAGIGLYDAKTYYDEGDKKTAGLVGLFSIIPGIGGLASKMGLAKWSAKALSEIAKKISLGKKLLPVEIQVANKIVQYRNLITAEMKKIGETATTKMGTKVVRNKLKKQAITNNLKNTGKTITGYGAAGVGYSKGYDYVQKDTPKTKSQSEGYDWNFVKSSFGSSGTEDENKLLTQAWDKGWRPGQVVPKQYQTKQYQAIYAQETENINTLQQLVAQAKTQ